MKILDLTFPTAQENLACDEALLDAAEAGYSGEVLRFWSPHDYFVVLGYSNKIKEEILPSSSKTTPVPVFRRCSGGGTVLQGPGCLNYSLILEIQPEALRSITSTNRYIMEGHRDCLSHLLGRPVRVEGITDLTLDSVKFSGNAQRRKKRALLFHGTFLLDFDISRVESSLTLPERQPSYRKNRVHSAFLTNLPVSEKSVKESLIKWWKAKGKLEKFPAKEMEGLKTKYASEDWNQKF